MFRSVPSACAGRHEACPFQGLDHFGSGHWQASESRTAAYAALKADASSRDRYQLILRAEAFDERDKCLAQIGDGFLTSRTANRAGTGPHEC
jgi:hypothetical protein